MTAAAIRRASAAAADAAETGPSVLPMSSKDVKSLDANARAAALATFDASIEGQEGDDDADAVEAYRRGGASDTLENEGGGEDGARSGAQPRRRSPTTWLLKTSAAAVHRSHAEKGLEKRGADWIRRNEAAAAERCAVARELAVAEVEADTDRLALPDLEASLRAKVDDIVRRRIAGFHAQTVAVVDTLAYATALAELTKTLTDHQSLTMEQNARRWHRALAPVSAAALARLRLDFTCASAMKAAWRVSTARSDGTSSSSSSSSSSSAAAADAGRGVNATNGTMSAWRDAAWICFRDTVPWVCDRHAASVWVGEFESRRRGKEATKKPRDLIHNMTDATVREVANVFVATDLASHREGVRARFRAFLAVTVALAAVHAWMRWSTGATKTGREKFRRAGDRAEPPPAPKTPLTTAEKVTAATSKPAPWIKIMHDTSDHEEEETDGEEAEAGAEREGAVDPARPATAAALPARPVARSDAIPLSVERRASVGIGFRRGAGSDHFSTGHNPLLFAAQQPLPSVSSQETVADRNGSGHSSDADSPPSAQLFASTATPPSPSFHSEVRREWKCSVPVPTPLRD